MVIAAWLIILGLLSAIFGNWTDLRNNPNQNPTSNLAGNRIEIVLEQNRGGHYVVTGEINGASARLLLDTGATGVVIPMALAEEFGLQRGISIPVQTANGTITNYLSRIDELRIGAITLRDVDAFLNPAMGANDEILLGMTALSQLEMTQRSNQLILVQHTR